MHQWPMVPDHSTQYYEFPPSHHEGMCEDGHTDITDWTRSFIPRFRLGQAGIITSSQYKITNTLYSDNIEMNLLNNL